MLDCSLAMQEGDAARVQGFLQMIRIGAIQNRVAQDDERFLMRAAELSGQGFVHLLDDDAFSDPLPELFLRCPELTFVPAHDARRVFLLSLFFTGFQNVPRTPP